MQGRFAGFRAAVAVGYACALPISPMSLLYIGIIEGQASKWAVSWDFAGGAKANVIRGAGMPHRRDLRHISRFLIEADPLLGLAAHDDPSWMGAEA